MSRLPVAVTTFVALLILVTLAVTSAASKPPPKASPVNTTLPSISGKPAVGSTLQASSGAWQGTGLSYSFQWKRCSASSSCATIPGATGSSYPAAAADAGDTLQVSVTATNRYGSATATSTATAAVPSPSATYTNTAPPAISGTPKVGQTLTATSGSWNPNSASYVYAWQLCQSGTCHRSPTSVATSNTYVVQSSDIGYSVVAQVAPAGDFNDSADSQPTAAVTDSTTPPPPPPPPPPAPSGSVDWDGRASKMNVFTESGSPPNVVQTQDPANVWSCLCFTNNDVTLASNNTFGKDFHVAVTTGDTNPWGGSDTIDGAGQMSIRRNNDLGKWDWWAFAIKIPAWQNVSDLRFANLVSLGYQTSQGSQVGFGLTNQNGTLNWSIDQNAGYANNPTGWAAGTVAYTQGFQPVVYGQWTEFVLGVKVATDDSGRVAVYSRPVGGTWNQVFTHSGATELYGVTPNGTFAQDGSNWPTVIDKLGLYFGTYSNGKYTQTVDESGLTRSSDLTTAESTLP